MAFTPFSTDMNIIAALPDEPNTAGYTAAQLKAKFDEAGLALKEFLNTRLLAELSSSDGAGNIGIDTIDDMEAEDIQSALEEFKDMIDSVPSFTLPLSIANGGTGSGTAAAALSALGGASATDLTTHTGSTSNPHSVTASQVGASVEGTVSVLVSDTPTDYILQVGDAEDAASGYITIVLES